MVAISKHDFIPRNIRYANKLVDGLEERDMGFRSDGAGGSSAVFFHHLRSSKVLDTSTERIDVEAATLLYSTKT